MNTTIDSLISSRTIAYISSQQVKRSGLFDFDTHLTAIEQVYKLHYQNKTIIAHADYLKYPCRSSYDRIIILMGHVDARYQVSGVKDIASSTDNTRLGFPRASGLLTLHDARTQRPFAILEAGHISAVRTAAVTALAIKHFSPSKINKLAFIGCGFLAKIHLEMIHKLYPELTGTIVAYDIDNKKTSELCNYAHKKLKLNITPGSDHKSTIQDSDIIIPMTTEETPYIKSNWIKKNSLYTAVSLLDPELEVIKESDHIIVDDLMLSQKEGRPLAQLKDNGWLNNKKIFSIGELLTNNINLRNNASEKIYFNPMGTVLTDIAVGMEIVNNALKNHSATMLPV